MARKNDKQKYDDFVPYEKSSKREKKRRDNEKRNTWDFNPATQVVPDKKKYNRKKYRKDDYYAEDDDEEY